MPKRILSGTVVSSNSNKTIVVKVTRRVKHKLYKKIISLSKNYHVHDEENLYKNGDIVNIIESKPISKLKKWIVLNNNGDQQWYKCNLISSLQIILGQEEFSVLKC